jgi:type IX secretion system PorP/SprF family membrane protein
MKKLVYSLFLLLFFAHLLLAQDIHSSLNPLSPQLNPALTGMLRGDYTRRFQASHRSQWASVMGNGAYSTTQASYEQAIFVGYKDFIGLAASGYYDQAGKMPLRQSQLNINASYIKNLGDFGRNKHVFLSGGLQLGMAWRRFDFSQISWSEQFNGTGYNLSLPTGEAASLNDFPNRLYGDAGVGVGLTYSDNNDNHWRRGSLVWLNVGGSLLHIGGVLGTQASNISAFRDTVSLLRERWSAHASAMFGVNDAFYILPTAYFSMQARAFQLNTGLYANIRWGGRSRLLAANALQIGALMRFNQATDNNGLRLDAVIPTVRFDFDQFSFGVSYDVNTSVLRQASYGRGGFEFNFAWLWYRGNDNGTGKGGGIFGSKRAPKRREAVMCPASF